MADPRSPGAAIASPVSQGHIQGSDVEGQKKDGCPRLKKKKKERDQANWPLSLSYLPFEKTHRGEGGIAQAPSAYPRLHCKHPLAIPWYQL